MLLTKNKMVKARPLAAFLLATSTAAIAFAQPATTEQSRQAKDFLPFYVDVLEQLNPDKRFRQAERFLTFNEEHADTAVNLVAAYDVWVDENVQDARRARGRILRCVDDIETCELYLAYQGLRSTLLTQAPQQSIETYHRMLSILNPGKNFPPPERFISRQLSSGLAEEDLLVRYRTRVQNQLPEAVLPAINDPDAVFSSNSPRERLIEYIALINAAFPDQNLIAADTFIERNQDVTDRWYRLRRAYEIEMFRRNRDLVFPISVKARVGTPGQNTQQGTSKDNANGPSSSGRGPQSALWESYADAYTRGNAALPIPDFSHAGYDNSNSPLPDVSDWEVFRVEDFGAAANDNKSDLQAVRDAIRAAERHASANPRSGAVIRFGAGEYIMSDNGRNPDGNFLNMRQDRIALQGNGSSGDSRTTLFFPEHPELTRFGEYGLIEMGRRQNERSVTQVAASAPKGSFTLEVESARRLNAGDYIAIELDDTDATADGYLWGGYQRESQMTHRNLENGSYVIEFHKIDRIVGNTLELEAPLVSDIDANYTFQVQTTDFLTNMGVMDLEIVGNFTGDFEHHRSRLDNVGFVAIVMRSTADSWVKNVSMRQINIGVAIRGSSNATVDELTLRGKRTHYGVSITAGSSRTLVTNSRDLTDGGMQHPFSVSHRTNGTVFYCNSWPGQTGFDTHGAQPRATLFDNSIGGFLGPNGGISGTSASYPAHIDSLVVWNFEDKSNATFGFDNSRRWTKSRFEWWSSTGARQKLVNPHIVGWSGANRPVHVESTLSTLESDGRRFTRTPSLFEAQLALRNGGRLPAHVSRNPNACTATD